MNIHRFLHEIPKVELHCHLEGSVKASTFVELARKNGVSLPAYHDARELYEYRDFQHFLEIYQKVCHSVLTREDFQRITYESLGEAVDSGIRHREMFWSPTDHLEAGVEYQVALRGIIDGINDAEADFGITCLLIADINREGSPETGVEMVELVIEHLCDEVIGVGLDYNEAGNPPEKFWKAFRMAEQAGLHRTAHVAEMGGHPRNVETCLDLLRCDRLDHGYRILEDEALTQRCVQEEVVFTVVPTAHRFALMDEKGVVHWDKHPIKEMAAKGLKIVINSDDPAMMKIDPAGAYKHAKTHFGFQPADIRQFVLNGIDGAWVDEGTRRQWRREWVLEIDSLISQLEESGIGSDQ